MLVNGIRRINSANLVSQLRDYRNIAIPTEYFSSPAISVSRYFSSCRLGFLYNSTARFDSSGAAGRNGKGK